MPKAVALLSGGLDSTLAVKLMLDQGVEVHALNFTSTFCTCNAGGKKTKEAEAHSHAAGPSTKAGAADVAAENEGATPTGCKSQALRVASEFGIPVKVLVKGLDYIDIVRNPKHGYGKGINPCIDCRIYMFRIAKDYMKEIGADFIITGEVLGQRPMSQRRDAMRTIDTECGLAGLILRPLSASHFEPTIPEKTGLVSRDKLLSVSGRSRKPLMKLAEDLNVEDYPCPSGGCLLTDKIFSKKVRDLFDHKRDITTRDLQTLKVGRHFRYNGTKVVVSRDESENKRLKALAASEDTTSITVVEPKGFNGPVALVISEDHTEDQSENSNGDEGANGALGCAASLIVRYSSGKAGKEPTVIVTTGGTSTELKAGAPLDDARIEAMRVC